MAEHTRYGVAGGQGRHGSELVGNSFGFIIGGLIVAALVAAIFPLL